MKDDAQYEADMKEINRKLNKIMITLEQQNARLNKIEKTTGDAEHWAWMSWIQHNFK